MALVCSFAVMALFTGPSAVRLPSNYQLAVERIADINAKRSSRSMGKIASVTLLALCIVTGVFGTQNPFENFNMTFFWIIFVLAIPYATLLLGDFYRELNPWATIVRWCDSEARDMFTGVLPYPRALSYYPALLFYMLFIWLELFGELGPRGLSLALVAYTLISLAGAWLFGYRDWFQYAEFFAVFFRVIGYIAPWRKSIGSESSLSVTRHWRLPFAGLMEVRAAHISLLLFILFMLSSTAYDGLHQTLPWVGIFWKGIYPIVSPYLSDVPRTAYEQALSIYKVWQWLCLVASPFVYLAVLCGFVAAAKLIANSRHSVRDLSLRFTMSLVPIAIVYHITHYYPTLLAQGAQIVRLVSDPFGFGWNLFGTADLKIPPIMVGMGLIWGSQVALIVGGHIISSYLAHLEALRVFPTSKQAILSQLPILLLMIIFTTVGLKILSMPLAS